MDRGRARTYTSSVGSNYRVKTGSGSLYSVHGYIPQGGSVRLDDTTGLGAAVDFFSITSNATRAYYGPASAAGVFSVHFVRGVGFDDGLTVAGTSNARFTVEYE